MNVSTIVRVFTPTNPDTSRPFLNAFTAGMPAIPYSRARFLFASTSTVARTTSRAATASSSTGVSCLHGLHHSAQKSTTTGVSEERRITSSSQVFSSTSMDVTLVDLPRRTAAERRAAPKIVISREQARTSRAALRDRLVAEQRHARIERVAPDESQPVLR